MAGVMIIIAVALIFSMGYSAGKESVRKKLDELIRGKSKGRR